MDRRRSVLRFDNVTSYLPGDDPPRPPAWEVDGSARRPLVPDR